MSTQSYLDFIRERLGRNWVVARRTPNIVCKYGADVVCISAQRMRALNLEYRKLYGDPYDEPRALMYRALLVAQQRLELSDYDGDEAQYLNLIAEAIKAEQDRP